MHYQLVFDVSVLILFLYILTLSIKKNQTEFVLFGFLFGLLLEILTIYQTNRYSYGDFYIAVYEVPLSIAMSWSMIIYTSFLVSAKIDNNLVAGLISGWYGLHIDMIMDVIAIRINFWDWGNLSDDYFGVPYGNFIAWFVVISSFVISYRGLSDKYRELNSYLIGFFALCFSLFIVLLNNRIMLTLRNYIEPLFFVYLIAIFGGSFSYLYFSQVNLKLLGNWNDEIFLVMALFHGFFTSVAIIEGIFMKIPILIPIHFLVLIFFEFYDIIINRENEFVKKHLYLPIYLLGSTILILVLS